MKRRSSVNPPRTGQRKRGKQYPGVRGKVVNFIEHQFEEGMLFIHVRFMDKTEVSFTLGCRLYIKEADLSDISTGDYKLLKEYVAYEE
jgi:hypothetical protein